MSATKVARRCRDRAALKSLTDLMRMVQASLVAYATGGAFLGLAYLDLYYHLIAAVVIASVIAKNATAGATPIVAATHGRQDVPALASAR
jgi:hypothetical protein